MAISSSPSSSLTHAHRTAVVGGAEAEAAGEGDRAAVLGADPVGEVAAAVAAARSVGAGLDELRGDAGAPCLRAHPEAEELAGVVLLVPGGGPTLATPTGCAVALGDQPARALHPLAPEVLVVGGLLLVAWPRTPRATPRSAARRTERYSLPVVLAEGAHGDVGHGVHLSHDRRSDRTGGPVNVSVHHRTAARAGGSERCIISISRRSRTSRVVVRPHRCGTNPIRS